MKYIRTKDGRIIDVEKFINEETKSPYYTDFKFEEIENEGDHCGIKWTAVGTKENSITEQIGRRCQFYASVSSPFIAQANTIEELCDDFVSNNELCLLSRDKTTLLVKYSREQIDVSTLLKNETIIYGAIWTDKGLIYVAKMNKEGVFELL